MSVRDSSISPTWHVNDSLVPMDPHQGLPPICSENRPKDTAEPRLGDRGRRRAPQHRDRPPEAPEPLHVTPGAPVELTGGTRASASLQRLCSECSFVLLQHGLDVFGWRSVPQLGAEHPIGHATSNPTCVANPLRSTSGQNHLGIYGYGQEPKHPTLYAPLALPPHHDFGTFP